MTRECPLCGGRVRQGPCDAPPRPAAHGSVPLARTSRTSPPSSTPWPRSPWIGPSMPRPKPSSGGRPGSWTRSRGTTPTPRGSASSRSATWGGPPHPGALRRGRAAPAAGAALAEEPSGPAPLRSARCSTSSPSCTSTRAVSPRLDPCSRRARRISERSLGPDHSEVATIYHNLGGLEHARGRYARGEPYARRSVAIREEGPGSRPPRGGRRRRGPGGDPGRAGEARRGRALYRPAPAVFERVHGSEHYEIAINLNNLGALHQARGDLPVAEAAYRRARAIKEKFLGPDHPDVAMTLHNLAMTAPSGPTRRGQIISTGGRSPSSARLSGPSTPRSSTACVNFRTSSPRCGATSASAGCRKPSQGRPQTPGETVLTSPPSGLGAVEPSTLPHPHRFPVVSENG